MAVSEYGDAVAVVRRLREGGQVAYFAGGCVRDQLLGLQPVDFDVATDAPPERVRAIFPNTQAVGAAFGVILVRQGKSVIEVATFRIDGIYRDGRRPEKVMFATPAEDAQRRDFTINGLFFDPIENKVIDFVGGREDLAGRKLRAIGKASERFEEDHLRMLRAVRFAARFDLEIDAATAQAIGNAAGRLKGISPERIAEELRLMLMPGTRRAAWALLWGLGLGGEVFRAIVPGAGATGGRREVFWAVDPGEKIEFGLALAAATIEIRLGSGDDLPPLLEKGEVRRSVTAMRKTLKISNEESDAMEGTLSGLGPLLGKSEAGIAMKKRFLGRATAKLSRKLLAAFDAVGIYSTQAKLLEGELRELEKTEFAPPPLLSGDDLTAAGWQPGPVFRRVLDGVYDAQLEGKINSREEAMGLAREITGSGIR